MPVGDGIRRVASCSARGLSTVTIVARHRPHLPTARGCEAARGGSLATRAPLRGGHRSVSDPRQMDFPAHGTCRVVDIEAVSASLLGFALIRRFATQEALAPCVSPQALVGRAHQVILALREIP